MSRAPRADDLYALSVPADVRLSPDGRMVAYVVKSPSPGRDGYRQSIWLAPADASAPARQVTLGARNDTLPRWSPDGRSIAFLSDRGAVLQAGGGGERPGPAEAPRDGGTQVWILGLDGGEARPVSRLPHDVTDLAWRPDGSAFCVVSTAEVASERRRRPRRPEDPPESDYRFMDRLQYQSNASGFTHDRYAHLWLVDVETGEARRLTGGPWHDGSPAWSPDGSRIAFESRRHADHDLDWQVDVFVLEMATGRIRRLTAARAKHVFVAPAWSPDGAWVAAIGYVVAGRGPSRSDVWRFPADGSEGGEDLTGDADLMVGAAMGSDLIGHGPARLGWSADGRCIAFTAPAEGSYEAWSVEAATRSVRRLTQGDHFLDRIDIVGLSGDRLRFAASRSDATHAPEIVTFEANAAADRPPGHGAMCVVSDIMASRWADIDLVAPVVRWQDVDGRRVQGWFYPATAHDGRPAPLVVEIHGGPATLYGYSLFWEWQCLLAQGISVFACNPRGSDGYGQDFMRANFRDWGHGPMRDVMAGVEGLVADGLADGDRLGVTGGSYGGYLTSWIIGQTDRFKAAVTCRSVNDMTSQMLSGDIGGPMFGAEEYGTNPWEDHELYWEHSPIAHARNVHTPLLIQHAERDLRVPVTQAEEFFAVLRSLRRPVRLMRVPDETHELTRSGAPFRRVENAAQIVSWFRHFLVDGKRRLPPLPREKRVRP